MKKDRVITISQKDLSKITLIMSLIYSIIMGCLATLDLFYKNSSYELNIKNFLEVISVYIPIYLILFLLFSIGLILILKKKTK